MFGILKSLKLKAYQQKTNVWDTSEVNSDLIFDVTRCMHGFL
jgi:hypothetical protein